ncbi:MAG: helix-turn-helix domain-containing protein [Polyangiaceae bacterium]|nr:helix-turn-helix domain-containing protein [Polyangiaceae bacterium]
MDEEEFENDEIPVEVASSHKLIAVGGGRAGSGSTLLATNLAVYLAQLGRNVVLIDADAAGSNVHAHFGRSILDNVTQSKTSGEKANDGTRASRPPPSTREEGTSREPRGRKSLLSRDEYAASLIPTGVAGLSLLPAPLDSIDDNGFFRASRKRAWSSRLQSFGADYVVVDVGPGASPFAMEWLALADLPITVAVPEPSSMESAFRLLRAMFARKLLRSTLKDRFERPLFFRVLEEFGHLASPLDIVRKLETLDKALAERAWAEATRFRMDFVMNRTRLRSEADMATSACELVERHYGIPLEELGFIEEDEAVGSAARHFRPLLVENATSKAGRNIERIARRVASLLTAKLDRKEIAPPIPLERPHLYEVLRLTHSSSDEEIRKSVKRQRDLYADNATVSWSLLSNEARKGMIARLDEAHDTLLDPVRRKAYDLSMFPETATGDGARRSVPPPLALERRELKQELLRELDADTEFTGALLRKVREAQGVEIEDISAHTKISKTYLLAIEEENDAQFPAEVYLRGFLVEFAKTLGLDPNHVSRSYLKRTHRRRDERIR